VLHVRLDTEQTCVSGVLYSWRTANPIAGAILAHTGSWGDVKTFCGVLLIVGTTMVMGTRVAHVGWKLTAVF
jgi:hypothetical protein